MTSWTAPKTWSAATLTSAELNTHVRDNLKHLKEQLTGSAAVLSSDQTTASATWGDVTGLSFTCVSGTNYSIEVLLTYEHSSTSGGPVIGFDMPGGTGHLYIVYAGETSATSSDTEAQNGTDGTGGSAGVATVNGAGNTYFIRAWGRYACTADGTWQLRFKRNTTGTLTVHKGSSVVARSD